MNYKNERAAPVRYALPRFVHKIFLYSSYCRMLLEPIIRRRFGKQYFPFWKAVLTICVLACWPLIVKHDVIGFIWNLGDTRYVHALSDKLFLYRYGTWYAYFIALLVFCICRKIDAGKGNGSKSPTYAGDLPPVLYKFNIGRKTLSLWVLEVICEPALFMICGVLLWKTGQSIGPLLMICAAGYSISYFCAYLITEADALDRISNAVNAERFGQKIMEDIPTASAMRPPGSPEPISPTDDFEDVL